METQHNLARVLREVEAGHEVGITRRNQLVARLVPPAGESEAMLPDFVGRARKVWSGAWEGSTSDDLLDDSRGER
jgi:antitoxin (DNA-binding transcriptional repressor) of toxin-antitoxin stability system